MASLSQESQEINSDDDKDEDKNWKPGMPPLTPCKKKPRKIHGEDQTRGGTSVQQTSTTKMADKRQPQPQPMSEADRKKLFTKVYMDVRNALPPEQKRDLELKYAEVKTRPEAKREFLKVLSEYAKAYSPPNYEDLRKVLTSGVPAQGAAQQHFAHFEAEGAVGQPYADTLVERPTRSYPKPHLQKCPQDCEGHYIRHDDGNRTFVPACDADVDKGPAVHTSTESSSSSLPSPCGAATSSSTKSYAATLKGVAPTAPSTFCSINDKLGDLMSTTSRDFPLLQSSFPPVTGTSFSGCNGEAGSTSPNDVGDEGLCAQHNSRSRDDSKRAKRPRDDESKVWASCDDEVAQAHGEGGYTAAAEDAEEEDAVQEHAMQEDVMQEDAMQEDAIQEDAMDAVQENAVQEGAMGVVQEGAMGVVQEGAMPVDLERVFTGEIKRVIMSGDQTLINNIIEGYTELCNHASSSSSSFSQSSADRLLIFLEAWKTVLSMRQEKLGKELLDLQTQTKDAQDEHRDTELRRQRYGQRNTVANSVKLSLSPDIQALCILLGQAEVDRAIIESGLDNSVLDFVLNLHNKALRLHDSRIEHSSEKCKEVRATQKAITSHAAHLQAVESFARAFSNKRN